MMVFASPETATWTLVAVTAGGLACVLAVGRAWQPVPARPEPSA